MLEKTLNRIMDGAKTPEGKVIAILLTISLALMTWNVTSIKAAFATDEEDLPAASDIMADESDVAAEQEAVQEAPAAPEAPAAVEAAEPAAEEPADSEAAVEPAAKEGDASQQAAEPADDEAGKEADPAEEEGEKEEAEETAYPAVTFDVKYVGDAAITVSAAEGVFPEGANVEFGYVDSDSVHAAVDAATDDELTGVQPVKLVFRDADGTEIAPKGQVTVKVSWATPLEGNAHVFTISDSGAAEAVSGSNLVSATPSAQEFKLSAEQAVRAFAIAATTADVENATADDEATEEKAAEPERTESAETGYPEQTLIGHAGWTSVHITAPEGSLPEDAKVVVKKVDIATVASVVEAAAEANGKSVDDMVALDVTITDKDGNEIQPLKPVKVEFVNAGVSGDDISVYHVADDKGSATEVATEKAVDVVQSFETEGFSIYAIVGTGADARIKVIFKGLNDEEIDSMYVKQNDDMEVVLYDPGAGDLEDGIYFRGWTTAQNYTTETVAKTIDEVRTEVANQLPPETDGKEITYYAMLFKDYRITYLDENQISLGQEEVTFRADSESNEQRYKVNMAYTVQDSHYHFEGWKVREGGSYIDGYEEGHAYQNNDIITITGDIVFGVNAPKGNWFIFDENGKGATYNAPQFVYTDKTPKRPDDTKMIRNGYTFGGWYADKAVADQASGGTQYNFNQTLTDKTTVYARWIPNGTAPYTIIIWKQNLDGNGYDFYKSISGTGTVGQNIGGVSSQGSGNGAYARINGTNYNSSYTEDGKRPFEGFHLKEFDQNVEIKTEGNSVLNVYYDRNEHTLQFQVRKSGWVVATDNEGTQYRNQNWDEVYYNPNDGKWYRNRSWSMWSGWSYSNEYTGTRYKYLNNEWTTIKEIKALYGQSISDQFPIVGTDGVTYTAARWDPQSDTPYSEVLSYIDTMPNADVVFHRDNGGPGQGNFKNIYYYVEALPGETGPTVSYNGKTFVLYKHLECNYYFFTEAEDYLELVGYTKYGVDPASGAWGSGGASTVKCYYTRNVYPINFMDGKYVNGDGNPMDESGMGQINTESGIAYGADISSRNNYKPDTAHTPAGYVFEGWYIDSACTQKYTFDKMPEGGITVYAKWRQKQYRVFLHVNYPEGATGNINWGTTNQAMTFRISEGGHVSEPTGRDLAGFAFDGWYLDPEYTQVFNGDAYVINESNVTTSYDKTVDMTDTYDNNGFLIDPKSNSDATGYNGGDRFWITKKLDIYAKWHSTLEGASGIVVEYDANGGTGAPVDTHTYVDTAKAPAGAASKSTDPKKVFGYWEVQKWQNGAWIGTGEKVLPGDTFTVLKANAKVEDLPTPATNGDTKKYTVQLKAVYIDSEEPTPTHIYWYKNDGSDAFNKNDSAEINVGMDIPSPAPEREGYTFLGWARVDIGQTQAAASAWEANRANWTQNLTASNLYLHYEIGRAHV